MVQPSVRGAIEVDAELRAPGAQIQLVHYHFDGAADGSLSVADRFRVELCLSSRHRSARGCFTDHWSTHRYEHLGDLFVVGPGMALRLKSDEAAPLTSVVCQLRVESIFDLYDRVPTEPTEQQLLTSLDVRNDRLRALLLRMAEEARHPGFAAEMMVDSIAAQMAVELYRHGSALTEPVLRGGLAFWQLQRIEERVREVRETPTLAELATLCRVSVRHLTRGFRTIKGCSLGAYVANSQIEHAKRLLIEGETVASVARTLGFSTASNFCFAFRRAIGLSPGAFQLQFGRR